MKTKEAAETAIVAQDTFVQSLQTLRQTFFPNSNLKEVCQFIGVDFNKAQRMVSQSSPKAKTPDTKKADPPKNKIKGKGKVKKKRKKRLPGSDEVARAAEGRRAVARGDRPPLKEAMATVIGKATMGAKEVIEALTKRGWMPASQDPQQYISFMLSSNKDVFENVSRGRYRVRKEHTRPAKQAAPKPKPSKQKAYSANNLLAAVRKHRLTEFGRSDLQSMFALKAKDVSHLNGAITALVKAKTLRKISSEPARWAVQSV